MKRYGDIKLEIKALNEEAKKLEPSIVEMIEGRREGQARTEDGLFYFSSRKTWSYSEAVTTKEKTLKTLKAKEQKDGVATAVESKTLTFRAGGSE